ncbi:hypothetical protein [Phreatobacter oligotrophus]|uniref:Phage terminase large subunit-like protein n=1 Tax=Phreatobacter oligotrophus TaxID=1122261 RepID=A0A2T4ZIU4_9HYPH|nr:hypothetical protein [Phreatobacter oligotrophus]PTM61891.1 hypothetical protein C8P69_101563 [Phreatobacter oligotrophus]
MSDPFATLFPSIEAISPADLVAAMQNRWWRLTNLYWIQNKDGVAVRFNPNEAQRKFLLEMWYRNVVPKARQRGFSTLIQILMLDTCLFKPGTMSAVIAQDEDTAKQIRNTKIKFAWERLPAFVKEMVPLTTDNITELVWANGSTMLLATSVRGGTVHFLHISELGKIVQASPLKVEEIQQGSIPAVPPTGILVIESTVEGPHGLFADFCRTAQANADAKRELTPLDFKLHFASWWDAPEYRLDPRLQVISPQMNAYFERVEAKIGRPIDPWSRAWYAKTLESTFSGGQDKMKRQYPSFLEEAFEVSADGLWLSEPMARARRDGRIGKVPLLPGYPVNTFWDIGTDDATSIWLHQRVNMMDNFVGYIEGSGEPPSYYVRGLEDIRAQRHFVWGKHFLPHDGSARRINAEVLKTYADMIRDLGFSNVEIVPRTTDLNAAIDGMREEFTRYQFDEEACAEGIKHLDGFSKAWNATQGVWTGGIMKNGHQHAADALRQKSQAEQAGLINTGPSAPRPRRRASAMAA